MSKETMEITPVENWRPRVLIVGGVLGALVGVAAAYLLIQRAEEDKPPKMNIGEGVKLGVLVFSLLRSIASL
jgi:CBS-domain-containing membrane protein